MQASIEDSLQEFNWLQLGELLQKLCSILSLIEYPCRKLCLKLGTRVSETSLTEIRLQVSGLFTLFS